MINPTLPLKPYPFNQLMLFPPDIRDLIPSNHLVRVVNSLLEKLDVSFLHETYKGGGCSAYDPRMLLKILVYAYTQKIFTSRKIAKALKENIHFMWLSGFQSPDFRTINRFRKKHLGPTFEKIFANSVEFLGQKKLLNLNEYFVDGTKIEADANRYSFCWKKATDKFHDSLQAKVSQLFQEIEALNRLENEHYGDSDLEELGENRQEITATEIDNQVKKLEKQLSNKTKKQYSENDKVKSKALKKLKSDFLPRARKYEHYKSLFNGRNNFSKTDPDATFMCMKEDHMLNRKLKPGYNLQIGTNNQFVINYSVHQNPGDTLTLIPHLNKLQENLGRFPEKVIADAGYGSEENYTFLEAANTEAYVKFNLFQKQSKKAFKKEIFHPDNLKYDAKKDQLECPAGEMLSLVREKTRKTENGFLQKAAIYRTEKCGNCSFNLQCAKGREFREISINHRLRAYKEKALNLLKSEEGIALRKRRATEPETVFGNIKHNMGFKRLRLRGMLGANVECGLICMAHNMIKMA